MKNRVLALIVAVMMLLSAFILAGCKNEGGEESTKELTAKELFEVSLKNLSVPESNFVSSSDIKGEMKFDLTVDKFVFGDTDVTALGNISLTGTGLVNGAENVQAAFELSAFGEKVPFECLTKNDNYFIVDFLGLNDKAIKLDVEQAKSDAQGANAVLMNAGSFYEIIEHVANSAKTVIDTDIDDSVFSMDNKDVTVLGQDFTGAKVIVLTLGKEQTTKIVSDLIDELLKNEEVKKLFGEDFDKEEALKELDDFTSMQIINTVVDEKSVALSIFVNGMAEVEDESADNDIIDESVDESIESDDSEAEPVKEERTFGIIAEFVGNSLSLDMGFTTEGKIDASIDGAIYVDYKEENDKFDFNFTINEEGKEDVQLVSAKGDIIDGEYDGAIIINADGNKIEVEFYCSSKENESEFGITKIKTIGAAVEGGDEVETTLPIEFSLKYKYEENKVTTDGKLNVDIEGMTKIDVSLNAVTELKDVTIDPISSFDDIKQLDMNAAMTQAAAKYPKTFAFINGIISSFGGSDDDDSYYEKDGLGLWLTEDFEEVDNESFTAVYYGSDCFVFTYKDSYDKFVGYGDFDFEDYVNAIYVDFLIDKPTEVKVDSYGIPYFEYTAEGFRYYVAMYEGYDGYWMVMFGCNESIYEANRPLFVNWAAYADPFASEPANA